MARTPYGGDLASWQFTFADSDGVTVQIDPGGVITVYDVEGGTQITDLQDGTGAAIPGGLVEADSTGSFLFYPPEAYTGTLWLRSEDEDGNVFWARIQPSDAGTRLSGLEAQSARVIDGVLQAPDGTPISGEGGVPETEIDAKDSAVLNAAHAYADQSVQAVVDSTPSTTTGVAINWGTELPDPGFNNGQPSLFVLLPPVA